MGIFGWNPIGKIGISTLKGLVNSIDSSFTGSSIVYPFTDGDWSLLIEPFSMTDPDGNSVSPLVNSHGKINQSGLIECEIMPTSILDSPDNAKTWFGPLIGKVVSVTGVFVEDLSHDDRTEIHPISSVLIDHGDITDGLGITTKKIEIFLFSDNSEILQDNLFSKTVILSGQNMISDFQIGFPPSTLNGTLTPRFTEVPDFDMSNKSAKIIKVITDGSGKSFLSIHMESGTPSDSGFYHGFFFLWLEPTTNYIIKNVDGTNDFLDVFHPSYGPKRLVQNHDNAWSLRYNIGAKVIPQDPNIAIKSVKWTIQRDFSPGNADAIFQTNPLGPMDIELARNITGQINYMPMLYTEITNSLFQKTTISNILNLIKPKVFVNMSCDDGKLISSGSVKKAVWSYSAQLSVSDFAADISALKFNCNLKSNNNSSNINISIPVNDNKLQFQLEFIPHILELRDYSISLDVSDSVNIEEVSIIKDIVIPPPKCWITGRIIQKDNGFQFLGSVHTYALFGNLCFQWNITNNGWTILNISSYDKNEFSFDFELDATPTNPLVQIGAMYDIPSPAPIVNISVMDELGQAAQNSLDIAQINFDPNKLDVYFKSRIAKLRTKLKKGEPIESALSQVFDMRTKISTSLISSDQKPHVRILPLNLNKEMRLVLNLNSKVVSKITSGRIIFS